MFIAALFIIPRTWKHPRCPSADEWISIVPNTIKTKQLINRKNVKISYGYNPTLDSDTDSKESKAVARVFPWEHFQDSVMRKQEKDLEDNTLNC